jgi:hypothetical protein
MFPRRNKTRHQAETGARYSMSRWNRNMRCVARVVGGEPVPGPDQARARLSPERAPAAGDRDRLEDAKMKTPRFLALAVTALVAVAAAPASTGADNRGTCGIALTSDASIMRLDRVQSAGAAKICAMYLNTIDAQLR